MRPNVSGVLVPMSFPKNRNDEEDFVPFLIKCPVFWQTSEKSLKFDPCETAAELKRIKDSDLRSSVLRYAG